MSKIDRDTAIAEFERWADIMDLDGDLDGKSKDEKSAIASFKAKFVKRVQTGALTVSDDGVLALQPRGDSGEPIEFDEPTGRILSARRPDDTDVQASRRILADWTGQPAKRFADMTLRDFSFCAELIGFFSNS